MERLATHSWLLQRWVICSAIHLTFTEHLRSLVSRKTEPREMGRWVSTELAATPRGRPVLREPRGGHLFGPGGACPREGGGRGRNCEPLFGMQNKCRRTCLSQILEHNCETDKTSCSSQYRGPGSSTQTARCNKANSLTGEFRVWDGFGNVMKEVMVTCRLKLK